jgi:hypothetical protein
MHLFSKEELRRSSSIFQILEAGAKIYTDCRIKCGRKIVLAAEIP